MMGFLNSLLGRNTSNEQDTSNKEHANKPCNVSGHDWPEWEDDPFSLHTTSVQTRGHELRIYKGQNRRCRKCDKFDTRKKTIGYLERDGDDIWVV